MSFLKADDLRVYNPRPKNINQGENKGGWKVSVREVGIKPDKIEKSS